MPADLLDLHPEKGWKQPKVPAHAGPQSELVSKKCNAVKHRVHRTHSEVVTGVYPHVSVTVGAGTLSKAMLVNLLLSGAIQLTHHMALLKDRTIFYSRVTKQCLSLV